MQPKEQPLSTPKESWPGGLPRVEDALAKEKVTLKKLGTHVADIVRDIGTANEMAKDKFEGDSARKGDSALMHAARGGVTAMIGAVLELAVESQWKETMKTGKIFVSRGQFNFGENIGKLWEQYQNNHVRSAYFVENTSKDLISGLAYNTLSYFSNRMLPAAEPKHLVLSVISDAVEAIGTVGLKSEQQRASAKAVEAKIADQTALIENYKELEPDREGMPLDKDKYYKGLQSNLLDLIVKRKGMPYPDLGTWELQTKLRKITKFSNPATLLGVDWILDGFGTLVKNTKLVRDARKEKKVAPGKKVDMPRAEPRRNFYDRKPYENRREYGNKPAFTKDKVFYGKSQWNTPKVEEEVDLAKFE